ncbi:MAG: CidA/LrgA family protein [Phascolarctobacterium sp.]|nr:CidA/LrgA family protein [Phascolarctobacterium sp.]
MSPTSLLRGIALLLLLQWVSTLIINFLGIPFPPALLGMLILTALLCGNIIPASSVEGICDILISKMGMLFLPAGVSVILYFDIIKAEWLPILATIIICSLAVMAATAFFLEALLKKGGH